MVNKFYYLPLVLIFWSEHVWSKDSNFSIRSNCDIPQGILQSISKKNIEECQTACVAKAECKAFVHVSGWNRCNLIGKYKQTFEITFISAEKSKSDEMQAAKKNSDHTGKDLRKVESKTWDDCARSCAIEKTCRAVTYIEGYRACWHKAAGGKFRDKVFSCGLADSVAK